jgi:fibronectin-binding autotransporter adhesin
LYLPFGATSLRNTGSITAGTAGIYNNSSVTSLTNYQGGNSATASTTALTYSGVLPTNYSIFVSSTTRYGQTYFSNASGSMVFAVDSGSSLAVGTYSNVITGVSSSRLSGTSGSQGNYTWSLSNGSGTNWNLLVSDNSNSSSATTSLPVSYNSIASGATHLASSLGISVNPSFTGGTLTVDASNSTYTTNITVDASGTNTINLDSKTATFKGVLSDVTSTLGALSFTGRGTAILTGSNTYSGTTTVASGTTLQVGSGGTAGTLGSGGVTNNGLLVFNRSDTIAVSNNITGTGSVSITGAGTASLSGTNTFSGGITVGVGSTLSIASASALGPGTLNLVGSPTIPAYLDLTASTTISNAIKVSSDPVFNIAKGTSSTMSGVISDGV